jgi:6-hydroxycyclohex-1-ene-1-carbonyl-CoA dehydrogenase
MKAALLKENFEKLSIERVSLPEIGDGDVLISVKACGVCHTDLHYIDHGVKTFKPRPLILGHEAAGIVESTGKNVTRLQVNDRVVIPAVLTCGECINCLNGRSNICLNMKMPGNHINGAYAEYISVPSKDILKLPENISFEEGALVADALSTAYHAVYNRTLPVKNSCVVVFGCGGIGTSIIQMAKTINATVIAVDIKDEKLEYAKYFGADYTINFNKCNIIDTIKSLDLPTIDTIYEAAGTKNTLETALKLASYGTKICTVGFMMDKVTINPARIMFMEQNIMGSLGCKPEDLNKVINLIQTNKINAKTMISNKYCLDEINNALDDLRLSKGIRPLIVFN